MEPSRQQAVRSDQNGWGATLRRALRSTHIIKREIGNHPILRLLKNHHRVILAMRCYNLPAIIALP